MKILLVLILVGALAAIAFWRFGTGTGDDDFDYAAAFEPVVTTDNGEPLLNIAELAGKSADELSASLGAPESCETSLYSSRCSYAPGRTEVVFIDGKADWITINALGETAFAPEALKRIGLDAVKPTRSTAAEMIWTDFAGLREVRVVGDADKVEFIRVKVRS